MQRNGSTPPVPVLAARRGAFTLIELLVVVGIIALLASQLLPALSRGGERARSIACVNNLKQLQLAFMLCTDDHDDVMPPNNYVFGISGPGATNASSKYEDSSWCPGDVTVDTNYTNVRQGVLFPFLTTPRIYRCPSDLSTITDAAGNELPRTRSYNLSIWINCKMQPGSYRRAGEMPRVTDIFTFIDTHEDGIVDPTFGLYQTDSWWADFWIDQPANRHNQGANLAFLDGRVEHWKWLAPKEFYTWGQIARDADDLADMRRLQECIPTTAELAAPR